MSDKIHTSPNTGWNDKLYRENYDKIFSKPKFTEFSNAPIPFYYSQVKPIEKKDKIK